MNTAPLAAAERTHVVLGIAVAALCGIAWGSWALLSAGAGALLGAGNLRAIRRLATNAVSQVMADEGQGATGRLLGAMFAKMIALFALVWLGVRVVKLDVLPFALGIMSFVLALLVAGYWWGQRESKDASKQGAV